MPPLNKMFTFAAPDGEDGMCDLLFCNNTGEHFTNEEMHNIMQDPLCMKLMGGSGVLAPIEGGPGELLLLTHDIGGHVVDIMDVIPTDSLMLMCTPSGGVESINLTTEYYNCQLPHRTIRGCKGCLSRETRTSCRPKEIGLAVAAFEDNEGVTPFEIIDDKLLYSRKSVIAGYTYVSPSLTATENFAKTYRGVEEHDFNEVEDRSARVSQGLRERGRRRRFKQKACSVCLVQRGCDRAYTESQEKYCNGPYNPNEKEAAQSVLNSTRIPFNNYQLLYLALNSGELDKRYDRCRYWATFRMRGNELTFGLCRYATGEYTEFRNFKEAKEVLCSHNKGVHVPGKGDKYLTTLTKALLIELASQSCSPQRVSRWHVTQYDVLGITYHPYGQSLELTFKYNNGGGWGRRSNGLILPWTVTANNFSDVFQEYTCLETLSHTTHPDSYFKTHNHY